MSKALIEQLQKRIEEAEHQMHVAIQEHADMESDLDTCMQHNVELQLALAEAQKQIDALKSALESSFSRWGGDAAIQARLSAERERVATLVDERRYLGPDFIELAADIRAMEDQ